MSTGEPGTGSDVWLDREQARAAAAAGGPVAPSARVVPRLEEHREPVSPVRAVAGATVAVAGVVLGIVAVLTLTDAPDSQVAGGQGPTVVEPVLTSAVPSARPAPPTPAGPVVTPPAAAVTTPPAPPTRPSLVVLNNSRRSGLADRAAARFRRGGWPVAEVGNYSRSTLSASTVFYGAGQEAAARRLAAAYDLRVAPRLAGLPGAGLVVVLTRSFPA